MMDYKHAIVKLALNIIIRVTTHDFRGFSAMVFMIFL
jgi:hypothetical protein